MHTIDNKGQQETKVHQQQEWWSCSDDLLNESRRGWNEVGKSSVSAEFPFCSDLHSPLQWADDPQCVARSQLNLTFLQGDDHPSFFCNGQNPHWLGTNGLESETITLTDGVGLTPQKEFGLWWWQRSRCYLDWPQLVRGRGHYWGEISSTDGITLDEMSLNASRMELSYVFHSFGLFYYKTKSRDLICNKGLRPYIK